ncbi:acyltransferase [Alteromonas sp. NFXS44]|uniref:acyltransferase family protein n=1 Tax=Alteromonas sp. NFXS44 TaxID=2818435 RepID=UPI0032DF5D9D
MQFRKDINGLRALAVIAVVLFHYQPEYLPGGFAGVDVFFVISGFLMTSIISRGLDKKTFGTWRFYCARAKRIVPALTAACLVLLVCGWFAVTPVDYAALSKHIASSLTFVSNIVYWQEAGYFDAASTQKWLLHTWSLSVEWQFYLLYPLILIGLRKLCGSESLRHVVLALTLLAFLANLWLSFAYPSASYFLISARAWEMLAGGVAFFYPLNVSDKTRGYLALAGLALIAITYFVISEDNLWPGYLAFFPVAGTFMVIQARDEKSVITTNVVSQKLGLWSYSIYLWHWIIVAANNIYHLELSFWLFVTLTTLAGWLSYRLIEQHHRPRRYWLMFILTLAGSLWVYLQQGSPERVPEKFHHDALSYHETYYGGAGYSADEWIYFHAKDNDYKFILIGDSYSLQYGRTLRDSGIPVLGRFYHGCPFFPTLAKYEEGGELEACSDQFEEVKQRIEGNDKPLVLAQSWDSYQEKIMKKDASDKLELTEEEYNDKVIAEMETFISRLGDRKYFLVGVPQKAWVNAYECLARQSLPAAGFFPVCSSTQPKQDYSVNGRLKQFAEAHSNVWYVDPDAALCEGETCTIIDDGEPVHSDRSHLAVHGAGKVWQELMQVMASADVSLATEKP